MSQNNPLVLVGFYQNLHHHASKAKFSICHRFFTGIDNVFFFFLLKNVHDLFRGATWPNG
jgi:hypothetical protein